MVPSVWQSKFNKRPKPSEFMIQKGDFLQYATSIIQWVDRYLQSVEAFPVKAQVKPKEIYDQIPENLPDSSETLEQILADLDEIILPGITHWQHPNFHGYFPANSSVESVLAEIITAALGTQCMIWETSPAAAELEERVLEWLRNAMGLPTAFEGVIQDTASSASLAAILTAREVKTNFRSNEEGVPPNLRIYCSEETHSSIEKGVKISGIGKRNLIKIPVDERQRLIPQLLESQIKEDIQQGYLPTCVIATIGTTGTLAVDPLKPISEICRKYDLWLHIDAAYAGSALLLPEYRWMIEGIEQADSFVFNPHKWLFTNFDCSAYFIKDPEMLIRTFDIVPEYLKTASRGLVNDYRDWGIPLGRRFRALKLWFVLRSFGLEGLQQQLREHIELCQMFVEKIRKSADLELMGDPFLNFCCFRLRPLPTANAEVANKLNQEFLAALNKTGKVLLSHTKITGVYAIRMVIGQTYVGKKHIEEAFSTIEKMATYLRK